MSKTVRVALWDAIHDFVRACGGEPTGTSNSRDRMDAVVAVERAVDAEVARGKPEPEKILPRIRQLLSQSDYLELAVDYISRNGDHDWPFYKKWFGYRPSEADDHYHMDNEVEARLREVVLCDGGEGNS